MKFYLFIYFIFFLEGLCISQSFGADPFIPSWQNLYSLFQQETNFKSISAKEIDHDNNSLIERISLNQNKAQNFERKNFISKEEAEIVYQELIDNPVVQVSKKKKYDPDGSRGFCFGEATFIHLNLIRHGVQKESIKKAFLVGDMLAGDIYWQFHVATIVKGPDHIWWVFDPVIGGPIDLKDWYDISMFMYTQKTDKKVKLFVTDAEKFGPSATKYTPGALKDPFYNNYFIDLMKWFKHSSRKKNFSKSCLSKIKDDHLFK